MGGEYSSYEVILKFSDRRLLFILSMHMWGYQLEIAMSCANFFNDAWDSPYLYSISAPVDVLITALNVCKLMLG